MSQAVPDSPPLLSAPSTSGISSRRSSRASQHVKFMTTTAVLHGRTITGLNGRFKSTGKSQKIFWDEHSSHVDCAVELEKELSFALNSQPMESLGIMKKRKSIDKRVQITCCLKSLYKGKVVICSLSFSYMTSQTSITIVKLRT